MKTVTSNQLKVTSNETNPPAPPFSKGGKGGFENSSLVTRHPLLKGLLIALWFSLLFLPFKGLGASLILFVVLSLTIMSLTSLRGYAKPLWEKASTAIHKIRGIRLSILSLHV